jgi:hypothetical protein
VLSQHAEGHLQVVDVDEWRPARCRVWIYLLDDAREAPVVTCSELPSRS